MEKRNFKNYDRNPEFDPDKFVEPLLKMLDLEKATTLEINQGVGSIEELVKTNKAVKTHQIRKLFSIIKNIENIKELNLERPHVKYIGSGQQSQEGKNIVEVIDRLIIRITQENKEEYIKGLLYIMESIVAYHRFHSREK